MYRILVWTRHQGWLSPERYPKVHQRFAVSDFLASSPTIEPNFLLLVDDAILRDQSHKVRDVAQNSRRVPLPVIAVGADPNVEDRSDEYFLFDILSESPTERDLLRAVRNATRFLKSERLLRESQAAVEQRARELEELNAIGIALSAERDHDKLLKLILSKSRQITKADAGSLFLVGSIDERIGLEDEHGDQARAQGRWLVFQMAQNDSREFRFTEEVLEMAPSSIAGYVAQTGKILNIPDAYQMEPDIPFTINRSFDETSGYRSRSMLVVPMQNREGEAIGVLQLINKKKDADCRLITEENFEKDILPFTPLDELLLRSLASQAAISVENNSLYQKIETLFDRFVDASVLAIESRDPVTQGHSQRVAKMTVELAQVVNRRETGAYGSLCLTGEQIRELKYAALLHDFGKVGVKEKILLKGRKLLSGELALVHERFNTIRRTLEAEYLRRMLDSLLTERDGSRQELQRLQDELVEELRKIDSAWDAVESSNQPTVTYQSAFERVEEVARRRYTGIDGRPHRFLEQRELLALKIPLGTLTPEDRAQIEEHVDHTFEFLSKIPWTRDLQNIPKLARAHHLKLDGSGYPRKLQGIEIAPQTRMMTISDIFDALVAQDRPYKPRIPDHAALDILKEDARHGKLDAELLELFIEAKVFENN